MTFHWPNIFTSDLLADEMSYLIDVSCFVSTIVAFHSQRRVITWTVF